MEGDILDHVLCFTRCKDLEIVGIPASANCPPPTQLINYDKSAAFFMQKCVWLIL